MINLSVPFCGPSERKSTALCEAAAISKGAYHGHFSMILVGYDASIAESWIFCSEAPTRTESHKEKPEVKPKQLCAGDPSAKPVTWSTYIIMLEWRMSMRSTVPIRRQGESPTAATKRDRVKRPTLRSKVLEKTL